jgi:hypothetical protein
MGIDMTKIIVLSYFNNEDVVQEHIFVGNEFSRDPSDVQQIIRDTFRTTSSTDNVIIENNEAETFKETWSIRDSNIVQVRRVLQQNGYTEHKPKRICV